MITSCHGVCGVCGGGGGGDGAGGEGGGRVAVRTESPCFFVIYVIICFLFLFVPLADWKAVLYASALLFCLLGFTCM